MTTTKKQDGGDVPRHFSPASEEQLSVILDNLATAFATDVVFLHCSIDPSTARGLARAHFSMYAKCTPNAKRFLCLEDAKGAILGFDYPQEKASLLKQIWHGLFCYGFKYMPIFKAMAMSVMSSEVDHMKDQYMKAQGIKSLIYIFAVGMHPDQQGKGRGSKLMAAITKEADAAGLHCYLEATNMINRRLYERHGFTWIRDYQVPAKGPIIFIMARLPQQ